MDTYMDGELLQKGGGQGLGDNQPPSGALNLVSWVLKCCEKKIVDNEKLLQSMYKHQEAQKKVHKCNAHTVPYKHKTTSK